MNLGKLKFDPANMHPHLVCRPTVETIEKIQIKDVLVAEIDPTLSDTAAFCDKYDIGLEVSANCVIVEAKRADKVWYAAIVVLATTRADINGLVRRELDARKISFAPMDKAIELTGMEFGGINPIGLPDNWSILVDEQVALLDKAIIGSGVRKSKLLVSGKVLSNLPNAKVINLVKS